MKRNPLDDLPTVHPRTIICNQASAELAMLLSEWLQKHKLTVSEELAILSGKLTHHLNVCVRAERNKQ